MQDLSSYVNSSKHYGIKEYCGDAHDHLCLFDESLEQKDSLPIFEMLVGLPGSGKSTYANKYTSFEKVVVSSDAIRGELFGDENCQRDPSRVFDEMKKRTRAALKEGRNVVYDATNLSSKKRIGMLKNLEGIPCIKAVTVFVVPFEVCVMRAQERERKVPRSVILKMMKQFEFPWWFEGWDKITMERTHHVGDTNYEFDLFDLLEEQRKIPHDSPYHPESIGEHGWNVGESEYLNDEFERACGFAHDIGKPYCKVFHDMKGNPTEYAHFYGHENVSAYLSVLESETSFSFYRNVNKMRYERAVVIQNHMKRYSYKEPAQVKRFYERLGYLGRILRDLNEADEACVTKP